MTIPAIGAITSLPSVAAATPTPPTATAATTGSTASGFAQALENGLQQVQNLQSTSDQLAVKAATGDLTDVHDYMIAANEAAVATDLTVAIRNKAVDAFNEIMRMQM